MKLTLAPLAALTIALALSGPLGAAEPLKARVGSGTLVGQIDGDLVTFRGVPFAAPPVGALRWAPPQKPVAWSGDREALKNAAACMQNVNADGRTNGGGYAGPVSEDCLYLNVFAPKAARKAPVMVWIHGGSNTTGSGAVYDGTRFARDGVVLFAINYRMGALGFFAHPALTKAARPDEPLANYAFMDQIAALQWVKRNAAAFGGDPDNITVFGESAGAMDIFALLGIPSAKGLFNKAILESNIGWGAAVPLARKETAGVDLATAAGLTGEVSAGQLRALPVEKVMAQRGNTSTTLDDRLVKESTYDAFVARRAIDVPLMVGWNSYEASLSNAQGAAADAFTDGQAGAPARFIATRQSTGAPSWLYHFSYVAAASREGSRGAAHASEITYVFGNARLSADPQDQAMSALMRSCWVAFAKTGKPACASGPAWPAYSPASDQLMEFAIQSGVRTNFRKVQLDAIDAQRSRQAAGPAATSASR